MSSSVLGGGEASQVLAAAAAIRGRWEGRPDAALVLGTGLHHLSSLIQPEAVIPYAEIPHFPRSTAIGHCGRLVCGRFGGRCVIAMDGRCHGYEGYTLAELTLPVRVMRALDAELLVLSNASGGLNPTFSSGDVVVVSDHLSLLLGISSTGSGRGRALDPESIEGHASRQSPPVGGPETERSGRRPIYDPVLVEQALDIARRGNFVARQGVYVAVTGPNYETRAEYRFLRRIGGDVVGMSTVPEAVAASTCGLRTLALSIVTNVARPDSPQFVCAADVIRAAERAEPHVRQIMTQVVAAPWPAV